MVSTLVVTSTFLLPCKTYLALAGSLLQVLPLTLPNLINALSLVIDALLIRFWKRNVQPQSNEPSRAMNSISGVYVPGRIPTRYLS